MSEATLSHRKVTDYSERQKQNDLPAENELDKESSDSCVQEVAAPSGGLVSKVGQGIWNGTAGVVGFTCGTLYSAACKSANAGVTVASYLPGAGWFRRSNKDDEFNGSDSTDDKSGESEEMASTNNSNTTTTQSSPKSKGWLSRGKDKDD